MDIFGQFIFALIAASLGYIVHRIIGFNIVGVISAIPVIFLLMPLVVLTIAAPSLTITELTSSLNAYLNNFVVFLPSLLIGHVAGTISGALFGRNGTFKNIQLR